MFASAACRNMILLVLASVEILEVMIRFTRKFPMRHPVGSGGESNIEDRDRFSSDSDPSNS